MRMHIQVSGTVIYLNTIGLLRDLKDGKARLFKNGGQLNFILIE